MKKTGKISALLCGLLLIGISGIYGLPKAYVLYQANSGKVAIHLEEYRMNGEKEVPWETEENVLPGGLISKIPRIVNDGADCYVRAKIVFTSEETSDQPLSADNLEGIGSEWVQDGEYFYCKEVVKSGESVDFSGESGYLPNGKKVLRQRTDGRRVYGQKQYRQSVFFLIFLSVIRGG